MTTSDNHDRPKRHPSSHHPRRRRHPLRRLLRDLAQKHHHRHPLRSTPRWPPNLPHRSIRTRRLPPKRPPRTTPNRTPRAQAMITYTRQSTATNKIHTREIPIKMEDFLKWQRGEGCIQTIAPYLSADDREFLISGTTPEEWAELFGEDD